MRGRARAVIRAAWRLREPVRSDYAVELLGRPSRDRVDREFDNHNELALLATDQFAGRTNVGPSDGCIAEIQLFELKLSLMPVEP